jgi:hypothetical protein
MEGSLLVGRPPGRETVHTRAVVRSSVAGDGALERNQVRRYANPGVEALVCFRDIIEIDTAGKSAERTASRPATAATTNGGPTSAPERLVLPSVMVACLR